MKAMIFAAGMGTRLRPITNNIPKALVQVNGKTMLELVIEKLIRHGFDEIIINVHYFAEKIIRYLDKNNNFGIRIEISNESDLLLDTGGGLKKAGWFFDDDRPFLLHNVDILSTVDLGQMYDHHLKTNNLATLSVQDRNSSRKLRFNNEALLCGWADKKKGEEKISRLTDSLMEYAFNGIHVIDPKIFTMIEEEGVFSIIDLYLRLAGNHDIGYYFNDHDSFLDIGTPEQLKRAGGDYN